MITKKEMERWCRDIDYSMCVLRYYFICAHTRVCVRTRVHAKRISMPQTVGQLLVLRRRASENHKLGRSEVTGYGGAV